MPSAEQITEVVNRYISLVNSGTADELVELYADDATVEDPVGGAEAAYVCRGQVCDLPVTRVEDLAAALAR